MTKIKVKITDHNEDPKKPGLLQCLCEAEAYVNRIIDSKEAFFLVVDHDTKDKILRQDVREKYLSKGMEVQFPLEHATARTVLLKNVDSSISHMTNLEIIINITPQLPMEKVVKLPGRSHLLKIMYLKTESADMAISQGINILFQRFTGNSIEKEVFAPLQTSACSGRPGHSPLSTYQVLRHRRRSGGLQEEGFHPR